jgi:cytochrome c1
MPMRPAAAVGGCVLLTAAACQNATVHQQPIAGADAGRGRQVIERVACGACHIIPGVSWPRGRVGPSLEGFAGQALVAGRFPNRPEIVAQWVRNAPSLAPQTGMPPIPMTEQEARDVAAYLYTLDPR